MAWVMKRLPNNRFDRIYLHLVCMVRNGKLGWHLAGVWRELTDFRKRPTT
jgi:hypothetical protein